MAVLTVKIEAEEIRKIVSEAIEKVKADNDLVKVIRCRDCKWSRANDGSWEDGMIICTCGEAHDESFSVPPDGFCSYGERKDTE